MAQITLDGILQKYKGGFQVGPLSMTLDVGVTCLLGANGSGKTTLLRMLSGVDSPVAGTLTIAATGKSGKHEAIGFLPQEFSAPKNATCRDFLYYVAWSRRVPARVRGEAIASALSRTGLLDQSGAKIGKLSGGMLRRLGIAQAIVHGPRFLVLDEPTVGLDPGQRLRVRDQVRSLAADTTVLYSTHLVEDVRALADRIFILRDGQLSFEGTTAELEESAEGEQAGASRLERGISAMMGVVS